MFAHLRANLWLLVLSLLICSVLYPLVLLGIGQSIFHTQAQGSLITGPDGKPVGSRLIAQPFSKDEYFQPRPSAASYKGDASAASNWAASNYLLRDRVARQLGTFIRYRAVRPGQGKPVGLDVEAWFKSKKDIVKQWANDHTAVAQAWVNADDKHKDAVKKWAEQHADAVAAWKKANPDGGEPNPADLAKDFFVSNAEAFQQSWSKSIDDSSWSVPAVFFDMWLQEHPNAELEEVPADMVMASGSGLDPHITLKNAYYQLDRVAKAWAERTKTGEDKVRQEIERLLHEKSEAPLGGRVGVELVNVLEVNLALDARYGYPRPANK
ncbi:MAG TPA: potassium-transporting ATPase subunit C [Gemmataceae bacterium]|nr:potassium-transporting ATPase subunit C [Gemmataceae bacterium]